MSSAAEICVSEESELPVEAEELSEEKARSDPPECVVLIANIQKQKNSGQMVRSAAAFGCSKVVFTGDKGRVSSFGAKGAQKHIPMVWGGTKAREAITKLKAQGFTICGIEITPDARPVHEHPFRGPTVFLPGAEGDGLPAAHQAQCDHFVYIPQCGNGTASLNVVVATSIVLHHFSLWASYKELPREGEKFVVLPPMPKGGGGEDTEIAAARRVAKQAERVRRAEEAEAALFGLDLDKLGRDTGASAGDDDDE